MTISTTPNIPKVALTPLILFKIWWAWFWRGWIFILTFTFLLRGFLFILFLFLNLPTALDEIERFMGSDFRMTIYNYDSMNNFLPYVSREILNFWFSFYIDYLVLSIVVGWEFKDFVIKFFPPDTQRNKRKVITLAWAWVWRSSAIVIPYTLLLNHLVSSALHGISLFIGASLINIVTLKIVLQKQFKNFRMILEPLPPKSHDS